MAEWYEEEVLFTNQVKVGDIIWSPHFEHLLFRDIFELDPMLGFYVNPLLIREQHGIARTAALENPGMIKRRRTGLQSYKFTLRNTIPFVVIHTERDCSMVKEFIDEDDRSGHFPMIVKARQLSPDNEWDENGLNITFYTESYRAPHCLHEVRVCSSMIIQYKNFLNA